MFYLVTMYRWGNLEEHNYSAGCFTKEVRAKEIGYWESQFRGMKYDPVITIVDEVPNGVHLNEVCPMLKKFIKDFSKIYK